MIRGPALQSTILGLAGLLFGGMNGAYYALLPAVPLGIPGVVYIFLLELATAVYSYNIVELAACLVVPERSPPAVQRLSAFPPVALVRCFCDDVDPEALSRSRPQSYPNLEVFALDDSLSDASRRLVDATGWQVTRRASRQGYKAGNLNNWFRAHGGRFKYLAVADADSVLSEHLVSDLVRYAEHPRNARTAIFESLLLPWNLDSLFTRIQALGAPLVRRLKLRIENALGSTMSVGHNNLYRCDAIREIGGFPEAYAAEDHATTLLLARAGWSSVTVPLDSYERLPSNVAEFAKRHCRYAAQTFELASFPFRRLSLPLCVKILRELHAYGSPVLVLGAVLLFIGIAAPSVTWLGPRSGWSASDPASLLWLGAFVLPLVLRYVIDARAGLSPRQNLQALLFSSTLYLVMVWPVVRRLFTFAIERRVAFRPTGVTHCDTFRDVLRIAWPSTFVFGSALVVLVFSTSQSPLNAIWIAPGCVAPLLLAYWQGIGA